MGLDTDAICAALLHDCIEDTERRLRGDREHVRPRRSRSSSRALRRLAHVAATPRGRAADGESAQDVHGHGEGHPRHPHQNRRPAAQRAHAPVPDPERKQISTRPWRRWRSTRRSRTGSACRSIKWELEDLSLQYPRPRWATNEIIDYLRRRRASSTRTS